MTDRGRDSPLIPLRPSRPRPSRPPRAPPPRLIAWSPPPLPPPEGAPMLDPPELEDVEPPDGGGELRAPSPPPRGAACSPVPCPDEPGRSCANTGVELRAKSPAASSSPLIPNVRLIAAMAGGTPSPILPLRQSISTASGDATEVDQYQQVKGRTAVRFGVQMYHIIDSGCSTRQRFWRSATADAR